MKFYKYFLTICFCNTFLFSNTLNENAFWIELNTLLQNHPKIKSQVYHLASKLESYRFAKTTYPDPKFGIMWKEAPYNKNLKFQMDKMEMSGIEYSITQPIPTPGKLNLMANIEQKEIEIERLNLAMQYNQLAKELMNSIINYHYDAEILKLSKELQKKFILLKESSKIRYSTGVGNFEDYSKAIMMDRKLEQDIETYKNSIQIYEKQWDYYFTSNSFKETKIFNSLIEYINFLYKRNIQNEERIQNSIYYNLAKLYPEIEREKITLQNYELYPDFEVFFSYLQREKIKSSINSEEEFFKSLNSNSGEDLMSFGIMFRIPLWSAFSNYKKTKSIEYSYQKEKENLKEAYLKLSSKIQEIIISIQTLEKKIEITEKNLLPYAELSYQSSLQNYTVGKTDFNSVMMSWNYFFEIQRDYLSLKKEYYNQIIEYLEITNQILPEIQNQNTNPSEVHYEININ